MHCVSEASEKEQKPPAFNLEMRSLTNETVAVFHLSFSLFAGVLFFPPCSYGLDY